MALDWQTEYRRYQRYFLNVGSLYRKKKVRVYTELVGTLLTISFFLLFAVKPTLLTIAGLIKTINDQKLITRTLEEKINALNLAQSQYDLIQSDLPLIEEALPQRTEITTLIKQLEAIANRSGVTNEGIQLTQIPLDKEGAFSQPEPINFNLAVSGDYQNLKTFLKNLSSLRRVILVDSFGFKTGKTDKLVLYLTLNNKTFYGQIISQ